MPKRPDLYTRIAENYQRVQERIIQAAQRAGRSPESVRLVVVTKGHPAERAQAAVLAGARDLGENYPEEGVAKMAVVSAPDVRWHMIGHVQRRKAALVVSHYDMLHALDRVALAERLERLAAQAERIVPVLLEFNIGGEASKSGWPAWDENHWDALLPEIEKVLACAHLEVHGLMAVPPIAATVEEARGYFRRLRLLRDFLARRFPHADWSELSMGMSADFEAAIAEGATMVRIGTAILGPRPPKKTSA